MSSRASIILVLSWPSVCAAVIALIRSVQSERRSAARASRKLGVLLRGYQGLGIQVSPAGCSVRYKVPGHGVQPERQARCPFRALAFPRLGVLASEVLLDVAEADLDAPTPGVA